LAYKSITKDIDLCIGSYAFLWGYKQEQTPTWYGLFTKDGSATQSIDVLNSHWQGDVRNRAPILNSFLLNNQDKNQSVSVKRGKNCSFTFDVFDFENDSLTYQFVLLPESKDKKAGGDFERTPDPITFKTIEHINRKIVVKAPQRSGPYRFFIYIYDNNQNVATANIPFYVK